MPASAQKSWIHGDYRIAQSVDTIHGLVVAMPDNHEKVLGMSQAPCFSAVCDLFLYHTHSYLGLLNIW